VQFERVTLSGDPATLAAELRELVPPPDTVQDQVAEIIARVRASGDDALRFYTRELDTGGTTPSALRVPDAELDTAAERLDDELRAALRLAIDNVMRVAEAALAPEQTVSFEGHEVKLREVAVDRGAVYVPGGRAPYPVSRRSPCARRPAETARSTRRSWAPAGWPGHRWSTAWAVPRRSPHSPTGLRR
jgi:histidinol dehydrogenase